jgi:hypothetical protein
LPVHAKSIFGGKKISDVSSKELFPLIRKQKKKEGKKSRTEGRREGNSQFFPYISQSEFPFSFQCF